MKKSISISLLDQALLSAFNLLLNLALIRFAGTVEFGKFTIVATFILVFSSIQNALTNLPISVLLPARPETEHAGLLSDLVSFDALTRIAMALAVLMACAWIDHDPLFLVAAAAAVYSTLTRETMRAICVARGRIDQCFAIDAVAVAVSAVAAGMLALTMAPQTACLAGIATGNLAAALVYGGRLLPKRLPYAEAIARYRSYWPDTRWSLTGAAATEAEYRAYVFALQGFRGTAALGNVQAGRLLMGPLNLFAQAWGRVARPRMAAALAGANGAVALKILWQGLALVLVIAATYLACLYLAWSWLEPVIYRGKYTDIGLIAAAWAVYTLLNVAQICIGILVQAAYRLRELAYVSIGAGLVSLLLLLALASNVHAVYAVLAITCGEVVGLVWLIWLALRIARDAQTSGLSESRS